ncbi:MAG: hypothetical protein SFX73_11750 [Kofleriaceae bacterium]|nr:hypothetical protein [Kofleriaceae bacterium]
MWYEIKGGTRNPPEWPDWMPASERAIWMWARNALMADAEVVRVDLSPWHPDTRKAQTQIHGRAPLGSITIHVLESRSNLEAIKARLGLLGQRDRFHFGYSIFHCTKIPRVVRTFIVGDALRQELACGHEIAGTVDWRGLFPKRRQCDECSKLATRAQREIRRAARNATQEKP